MFALLPLKPRTATRHGRSAKRSWSSGTDISAERVVAFLEAWLHVVPVRLGLEPEPELLMPHDVLSPWVLEEAAEAQTRPDYERALVASWSWLPTLASVLGETS